MATGTGIGTGICFSGSKSSSSYWRQQSEVLFFGEISKITGGKLYNQKSGATDYLTVGGSAGSYTFQCPNTAAYKSADTDYIWFKADETQRTATEAELIGYDLQRTPVKYLDDAPNSIEAILILSSAVTGSKLNRMFRDFHLPLMWNNELNLSGRTKSNRGATQQLWPGDSGVKYLSKPAGNDYAYVVDNGGLDVSEYFCMGFWMKGGVSFGGSTAYLIGKLVAGSRVGRYGFYVDGANNHIMFLAQYTSSYLLYDTGILITDEDWHYYCFTLNSPSSYLRLWVDDVYINGHSFGLVAAMGNEYEFYVGTANANLGAGVAAICKANFHDIIIYKIAVSEAEKTDLKNGIIKAGYAAFWKCEEYPLIDETGDFNLTGVNLSSSNILETTSIP